ncbi:type IV secretion system protein TraC [Providencia sp. wls1919]|nr:type IV secretion system protein TraC [Providencia sp. wls1919]
MSFFDKLTDTVNVLANSLKLPDAASKANSLLSQLEYPHFSSVLPYKEYDSETGFFLNDKSMGFILHASPLIGGNEQIALSLENLIRTKLPRNTPLSIHLISSKKVGEDIVFGLSDFTWSGAQAKFFSDITKAYYLKAAEGQFKLAENLDIPLTLRDYKLYISYSRPKKSKNSVEYKEMEQLIKIVRSHLDGCKINSRTINRNEFINLIREIVNHSPNNLFRENYKPDPYKPINYECVDDSFDLEVHSEYLKIGLKPSGKTNVSKARVMNFTLESSPEMAFLWGTADYYSNILYPELSISAPFIITMTLIVEEQSSKQNEANRKFLDFEKKSKTGYAKYFPQITTQAEEWGDLRNDLNTSQTALVLYYYNVTVFSEDDDDLALKYEQQVMNSYLKGGLRLRSPRYHHMRHFLAALPFMASEGIFDDLAFGGVVHRAKSFNVVNLMPLIADNRLSPKGLLAPTYRNQLAFIDLFSGVLQNTNFNMAVAGTSGAGKTGLIQPKIRSVLDSGGFAWIFDMGDGYKSLCENMGGVYLNAQNLKFNPFANITDINHSAERIRDQLSVMASPNGNLDEVHESLLLKSVQYAWLKHSQTNTVARIDDVVEYLNQEKENKEYHKSPGIIQKLDEIILMLDQYTQNGIYGAYFNSDKPSINEDVNMVVLELGELESRPSLLVAVMFSLILYIEDRMYQTPRTYKKLCVIDEGWKLLNFANKKVGDFIEKGYRTARRHTGSYITITQNIKDFDSPDASSAAKAAWGNSSYKAILKQSAQEFKKYTLEFPDQYNKLQIDVISRFGSAKDQHFSSFMLQVENNISWHRLFVDPLSRAMYSSTGSDFEFIKNEKSNGKTLHEAVYLLAKKLYSEEMNTLENWVHANQDVL